MHAIKGAGPRRHQVSRLRHGGPLPGHLEGVYAARGLGSEPARVRAHSHIPIPLPQWLDGGIMDIAEEELHALYTWVDEIPLSRPKVRMALVAELECAWFVGGAEAGKLRPHRPLLCSVTLHGTSATACCARRSSGITSRTWWSCTTTPPQTRVRLLVAWRVWLLLARSRHAAWYVGRRVVPHPVPQSNRRCTTGTRSTPRCSNAWASPCHATRWSPWPTAPRGPWSAC